MNELAINVLECHQLFNMAQLISVAGDTLSD